LQTQAEEKVWIEILNVFDWNSISLLNIVTFYSYRIVRNKEGILAFLEKTMREQIEKNPIKFMEISDYLEKTGNILNNLHLIVKKINVSNIPVEIGENAFSLK